MTDAMMGIFNSAHAAAIPFVKGSVHQRLSSTSTATVLVILATSSICFRIDLTEYHAPNLTLLYQISKGGQGLLERRVGIATSSFIRVYLAPGAQGVQGFADALHQELGASIRLHARTQAAFDVEHDLVRVLGILFVVFAE